MLNPWLENDPTATADTGIAQSEKSADLPITCHRGEFFRQRKTVRVVASRHQTISNTMKESEEYDINP